MRYVFGTEGTIGRARLWITLAIAQIALALVPASPILHVEEVTRDILGGSMSGVIIHLAPTASLLDWVLLALKLLATLAVLWAVASALIRRLHAVGWSGYWVFLLPAFIAVVEAEIVVNPGPKFSWTGLACLIAFAAIVLPAVWGVFKLLFVRGFDDGTASGGPRRTPAVSETPAP